jgi:4-hydroxy-2-oxoheptanedioate aldolase
MTGRRVGTVLSLSGVALAELLARHFDVVWIDLEHGALSLSDMQDAVIGVQASGAAALVRLPLASSFAPSLDAGADGIVVARVDTAEEAEEAARRIRLPPAGTRGYGPRRVAVRPCVEPPACVVQIETVRGVEDAARIASVAGVDALVVGCADLSHELGEPLLFETPRMRSAIDAVRDAARSRGVQFGVAGLPADGAPADADVVIVSCDIRIFDAALAAAAAAAQEAGERSWRTA